jgi:hypothetical protein
LRFLLLLFFFFSPENASAGLVDLPAPRPKLTMVNYEFYTGPMLAYFAESAQLQGALGGQKYLAKHGLGASLFFSEYFIESGVQWTYGNNGLLKEKNYIDRFLLYLGGAIHENTKQALVLRSGFSRTHYWANNLALSFGFHGALSVGEQWWQKTESFLGDVYKVTNLSVNAYLTISYWSKK